jgi:hypothetical protein
VVDGEIVDIDPELEAWPNERSLTYATRRLTQKDIRDGTPQGETPAPAAAVGNPIAE